MEKRVLTDHVVPGSAMAELQVLVLDEPGPGGANHAYRVEKAPGDAIAGIVFQRGPIGENGLNGLSHEALLAILIDRMRGFQKGPYACRENALALTHLEESLMWMQKRTNDRLRRGVEGTSTV